MDFHLQPKPGEAGTGKFQVLPLLPGAPSPTSFHFAAVGRVLEAGARQMSQGSVSLKIVFFLRENLGAGLLHQSLVLSSEEQSARTEALVCSVSQAVLVD